MGWSLIAARIETLLRSSALFVVVLKSRDDVTADNARVIWSSQGLMEIWAWETSLRSWCIVSIDLFSQSSSVPQCTVPLCHSRSSVFWSHCKSIWMLWIDLWSCCRSIFTTLRRRRERVLLEVILTRRDCAARGEAERIKEGETEGNNKESLIERQRKRVRQVKVEEEERRRRVVLLIILKACRTWVDLQLPVLQKIGLQFSRTLQETLL